MSEIKICPRCKCNPRETHKSGKADDYCRECRSAIWKIYRKKYYENNPDKARARSKMRRQAHPEKVKEAINKWRRKNSEQKLKRAAELRRIKYKENPGPVNKRNNVWREKNIDKVRESQRKYREKIKGKTTEYHKKYHAENKERLKEVRKKYRQENNIKIMGYNRERRAKKAGCGIIDAGINKVSVVERFGSRCRICGKEINMDLKYPDPFSFSIDHLVALALGGTHTWSNVRPAHLICNVGKGKRAIPEVAI